METAADVKEGTEMPPLENKGTREDETVLHGPATEESRLWSGILSSPTHGDLFSPSRDLSDKDCLHGLGQSIKNELLRSKECCWSTLTFILCVLCDLFLPYRTPKSVGSWNHGGPWWTTVCFDAVRGCELL